MVHSLTHLRDFLDAETLKHLPGNLQVGTFILLRQSKDLEEMRGGIKMKRFTRVIQVFNKGGTWIGEITHPDYHPDES